MTKTQRAANIITAIRAVEETIGKFGGRLSGDIVITPARFQSGGRDEATISLCFKTDDLSECIARSASPGAGTPE
jgi:hypothetical protein